MWLTIPGTVIVGYVLGGLPVAVLIARYRRVNIFQEGSGNPGATNIRRVLGKRAGNVCFVLDCLKGTVAAGWPVWVFQQEPEVGLLGVLGLLAAVLGHRFSPFIGLRGGKGVATTMGGLLALMPLVLLIGAVLWGISFFTWRYVSTASLVFAISLPISTYLLSDSGWFLSLSFTLAILLVLSHSSNLVRLTKGEEYRYKASRGK